LLFASAVNDRVLIGDNLRKSAVKYLLFIFVDGPEMWNVPFLSVVMVHRAKSQFKA